MSDRNLRLASPDLAAAVLLLAVCSFGAASALAGSVDAVARWALVVAAGGCGATTHRLLGKSVTARERAGFGVGFLAALTGTVLFGSAFLFGTPTDPVAAGPLLRAVACLSFGALVVATLATVTYLLGLVRRRESPEERADRIVDQVSGGERF